MHICLTRSSSCMTTAAARLTRAAARLTTASSGAMRGKLQQVEPRNQPHGRLIVRHHERAGAVEQLLEGALDVAVVLHGRKRRPHRGADVGLDLLRLTVDAVEQRALLD